VKLDVDFNDADGFPLVAQGMYTAVVRSVEPKESERTGNRYLEFTFDVVGGEYDGIQLDPLRNMIDMKDRNYYLKQTLETLGYHVEGLAEIDTTDLLLRTCKVQVVHEEYEGTTRAKIAGIYPLTDELETPPGPPSGKSPW